MVVFWDFVLRLRRTLHFKHLDTFSISQKKYILNSLYWKKRGISSRMARCCSPCDEVQSRGGGYAIHDCLVFLIHVQLYIKTRFYWKACFIKSFWMWKWITVLGGDVGFIERILFAIDCHVKHGFDLFTCLFLLMFI